jgi:hypothetical protein
VQADVDEAGCDLERRLPAGEVVEAEGRVPAAQELEYLWRKPSRVAELEGVGVARGQAVEEPGQALRLRSEGLGQLEQDRAELRREGGHPLEVALEAVAAVGEPLHVGEETAALAGEDEVVRRLLAPGGEGRARDQPVEGAVDLDRGEAPGVEGQLLLCRQSVRIKRPTPVPVAPARGADPRTPARHRDGV